MNEGNHNRQKQEPSSRKAALTTLVEEKWSHFIQPGSVTNVEPPPFRRVSPGPVGPLSRLVWYWHKDLAAKFFLVTIALLLIFSLVFAIAASHMLSQLAPRSTSTINLQPANEPTITGAVDLHPTFPVGHGPAGTNISSLPPSTGTVATLSGTPGAQGALQIVDIPGQVNGSDTVQVTVSGPPHTSVKLVVQYNASPYYEETSLQTFDDSGKATLDWDVKVSQHGSNTVTAQVTATGPAGQSDTVAVQIN